MVKIKSYDNIQINKNEVLRYAKCSTEIPEDIYENCLNECKEKTEFKICYDIFDYSEKNDILDLGFAKVKSDDLRKNLKGCCKIILFTATAGIGIDMIARKYAVLSPSKALLIQSVGSAAVEELCDTFCYDLKKEFKNIKPRFSPGYGDLHLELQRDIFTSLDPQKNIGVTLGADLLMTPTKSVTAIVGIMR